MLLSLFALCFTFGCSHPTGALARTVSAWNILQRCLKGTVHESRWVHLRMVRHYVWRWIREESKEERKGVGVELAGDGEVGVGLRVKLKQQGKVVEEKDL